MDVQLGLGPVLSVWHLPGQHLQHHSDVRAYALECRQRPNEHLAGQREERHRGVRGRCRSRIQRAGWMLLELRQQLHGRVCSGGGLQAMGAASGWHGEARRARRDERGGRRDRHQLHDVLHGKLHELPGRFHPHPLVWERSRPRIFPDLRAELQHQVWQTRVDHRVWDFVWDRGTDRGFLEAGPALAGRAVVCSALCVFHGYKHRGALFAELEQCHDEYRRGVQ